MRRFKVQYSIKTKTKGLLSIDPGNVEIVRKYLVIKAATLKDAKLYVKNKYPNATSIRVLESI